MEIKAVTLSPSAIEVLGQLFVKGPTWDGNICSKVGRGELFTTGLADRYEGFTFLTRDGMIAAVDWDTKSVGYPAWRNKQNGA